MSVVEIYVPAVRKVILTGASIKNARENGMLRVLLPSGAKIPFTFADGTANSFDVGRDDRHTYLVLHDSLTPDVNNGYMWNQKGYSTKGGYPASHYREILSDIYQKLPDIFREIALPLHIKQKTGRGEPYECKDRIFLLSAINVFGSDSWRAENDCGDTQIDIFADHRNRLKFPVGRDYPSSWALRTVLSDRHHALVSENGFQGDSYANRPTNIVVAICIENMRKEE